ncbi:gluconokinase [Sinosporangium siamense]|uniref:Gluconokinase n=1 Tax=Sinosporangium siamense TaxID=1367973 RepID=A0A919RLS0_9ACTN|nr:gluconokinase [Sinosporangium siamense]GII95532.1 gluconokinase [Sinosporangium siamense]
MTVKSEHGAIAGASRIVVMGVSGSGKSTVGQALAAALGMPFIDGDDLHPASNVVKMRSGIPLEDEDRWAWLDEVGRALDSRPAAVVACSALARRYRDRIRVIAPDVIFVHLDGPRAILESRLNARRNHFMPAALLNSQLAILEPLELDEAGIVADIDSEPDELVRQILGKIRP